MKGAVIVSMMMCWWFAGDAQNFQEWTQQKKTQIAYLVNQVAALQVYIELGQQGYGMVRDGLALIGDIKDSEFNLHNHYFKSLSDVNVRVSHSSQVEEIDQWNFQVQLFARRVRSLNPSSASAALQRLFAALAEKSSAYRAQVQLLLTGGHYQFKDDERIKRIDEVRRDMLRLYGFAKQTYQDAILQSKVSAKENKEIEIIERLQGIEK